MDLPRAHQGGRLPEPGMRGEPGFGRCPPWWAWTCRAPTKVGDYQSTGCERNRVLVDAHLDGHGRAARPPRWATTRARRQGFPHHAWKAMGTWCGQVGASIAVQAFAGVAVFCPRPGLFSTRHVESDGNLVWTSGCERCGAGVPGRGENLSTTRCANQGWHLPGGHPLVFHTARGKWWGFGVDKCVRVLRRKRFKTWCFFRQQPTGARNANAPHRAGRSGSIRCGRIRR